MPFAPPASNFPNNSPWSLQATRSKECTTFGTLKSMIQRYQVTWNKRQTKSCENPHSIFAHLFALAIYLQHTHTRVQAYLCASRPSPHPKSATTSDEGRCFTYSIISLQAKKRAVQWHRDEEGICYWLQSRPPPSHTHTYTHTRTHTHTTYSRGLTGHLATCVPKPS